MVPAEFLRTTLYLVVLATAVHVMFTLPFVEVALTLVGAATAALTVDQSPNAVQALFT